MIRNLKQYVTIFWCNIKNGVPVAAKTKSGLKRTGSKTRSLIGPQIRSQMGSQIRSWIRSRKKNIKKWKKFKFKIQNSKFCGGNYSRVSTVSRMFYFIQVWYSFKLSAIIISMVSCHKMSQHGNNKMNVWIKTQKSKNTLLTMSNNFCFRDKSFTRCKFGIWDFLLE